VGPLGSSVADQNTHRLLLAAAIAGTLLFAMGDRRGNQQPLGPAGSAGAGVRDRTGRRHHPRCPDCLCGRCSSLSL